MFLSSSVSGFYSHCFLHLFFFFPVYYTITSTTAATTIITTTTTTTTSTARPPSSYSSSLHHLLRECVCVFCYYFFCTLYISPSSLIAVYLLLNFFLSSWSSASLCFFPHSPLYSFIRLLYGCHTIVYIMTCTHKITTTSNRSEQASHSL